MGKILFASEDVEKLFDDVREKTSIPRWIEFKVLCNDKQKELCRIVKMNDLVETLTEGLNFAVVINEEIFNELPEDMQKMAIDECLAGVSVSDSDAVSLEKPDFNTYTGVLNKYGDDSVIRLKESIKSLFDAKKQREDEERAAKKAKRKKSE
jgi:hypothetical protein